MYKYKIPLARVKFELALPVGHKFLRTCRQGPLEELFMWFEVDNELETKTETFILVGTGQNIPDGAKYVSTYDHGPLVLHIYKLGE